MRYVKELIEELQRFNPEARLEHEVEISSYSPSTICILTCDDTKKDDAIASFKGEVDRLGVEANNLEDKLRGAEQDNEKLNERLDKIQDILRS